MLYIYMGLLAATVIWVSRKEALVMGAVWVLGLVLVIAMGKEGKEASYLFSAYQAIAGIWMAFRIHLKVQERKQNVSMRHTSMPFEFTPLNHPGNNPQVRSKHSIDKPEPE